jgi:hypothetical protein
MSDKSPPESRGIALASENEIPNSDADALIALLDYIRPEVVAISETAAILLSLARRALSEGHRLH